jgi:hypothetical protein
MMALFADFTLERDGAQFVAEAIGKDDLRDLSANSGDMLRGAAGQRIFGDPTVRRICGPEGAVGCLVRQALPGSRPVRAVLFDKSTENNWAVAWHQDRTIAVRSRVESEGFGPWSSKAGVAHVEPPFAILAGMVTLRLHLDDCGPDNAPLIVAIGSHGLGRVAAAEAAGHANRGEILACHARIGDVWLYATPILHASERAARPSRRRVLQIDFAASDLPAGLEWAGI